jgi:hypothetical protein
MLEVTFINFKTDIDFQFGHIFFPLLWKEMVHVIQNYEGYVTCKNLVGSKAVFMSVTSSDHDHIQQRLPHSSH